MLPVQLKDTQYCPYDCTVADKYNLFELLTILDNNNVPVDCYLNKPALIFTILHYQIDLPDKENSTPIKAIGRHLVYHPDPRVKDSKHSYCITIYKDDEVYAGTITEKDIIDIYETRYVINSIYCDILNFKNNIELYTVVLENVKTKEHILYAAHLFVHLFETDKITYIYNKTRNLIQQNKRI